jgi:hypothetical protein
MESSIAVFLLRQPACERLPTTPHRRLNKPKAADKPPHQRTRTEQSIQTQGATQNGETCVRASCAPPAAARGATPQTTPARMALSTTTTTHEKGLRDRNSPTCTLSQNGYGA